MKFSKNSSPVAAAVAGLLALPHMASAEQVLMSSSLESCNLNNASAVQGFSASLFKVEFHPDKLTLDVEVNAFSAITGNVTADLDVAAYGYNAFEKDIDPCSLGLAGLCPLNSGPITVNHTFDVPKSAISAVPGIAYTIPDLDGTVQIKILDRATRNELACVQAKLSNGKTVYQKGVGWSTAVVVGLALLTSAIVSGLGHSNTAAHVAANTLSLFSFFQMQAIFGMTTVPLPPIVASWTQNFQWSMGVIHVGFIQDICTWYQRATGGTPSSVLSRLATTSVNVLKRSVDSIDWNSGPMYRVNEYMAARGYGDAVINASRKIVDKAVRGASTVSSTFFPALMKRVNNSASSGETLTSITVRGIKRVGFVADIEPTNIFLTGYIFLLVFIVFVALGVIIFKFALEGLARHGKIKGDKFLDFRNGWTTILKGILFRIVLIGFPQMTVLCFWELTVKDSAGEFALALITILTFLAMLGWACSKVIRLARRSISMHKNPAYILYSDPVSLHKWGFLYVQFKATAYWFIVPSLFFTLIVGMFVAFGQPDHDYVQAIALLILMLGWLVGVSILRPWMDKKTNVFNISIAAINFVNSIFLLFFTDMFGLPGLVVGVMGVLWFIVNAVFALVLLIMVILATGFAIFSRNPDVRYQPMRDDRGSFIKSQSNLNTELDALGATARGETKAPFRPRDIDEDNYSSSSFENGQHGGYNAVQGHYGKEMSSSVSYDSSPFAAQDRTHSIRSSVSQQRAQHNASPWQRGAGYDR